MALNATQVMPGLVTVARFDGKHPSLACATTGGRVLIHSPHEEVGVVMDFPVDVRHQHQMAPSSDTVMDIRQASVPGAESGVRFLNINKNITAIAAGRTDIEDHQVTTALPAGHLNRQDRRSSDA